MCHIYIHTVCDIAKNSMVEGSCMVCGLSYMVG